MNSVLLFVFLWAKGFSADEIHSEMHPVYGDNCFTRPANIFGVRSLLAAEKALLIRKDLVVATTDATIAAVDAIVRSDWHVSILDIVQHTTVSRDLVHRIIGNHLQCWKLSARWVPKQLKPEQQAIRMMTTCSTTRQKGRQCWRGL